MNLTDVQEQIHADDAHKWDMLLERDQLRFANGRLRLPRSFGSETEDSIAAAAMAKGLKLTHWATSQMCQRLGIPAAYFRRCSLPLQDAQVNHWLYQAGDDDDAPYDLPGNQSSQKWLLRAKGDQVRGILSDRYSRLNNRDVLDSLMPLVADAAFEVDWFAVTEESLHLRLFDPRLSREVLPGDRVMAGLHIGNSEVGKRAITVDALVYRLVCQNGLVRLVKGKSLLHHRHVGLSVGDLNAGLGNAIRDALIQSSGFMERLEQSTREPVSDMEGVIATIASDSGLSQKTAEMVTAALNAEKASQQEMLFGLVNALTHTAQRLSPDERYALETVAGKILEGGPPKITKALVSAVVQEKPTASTAALPSPLPSPLIASSSALPTVTGSLNLSLFGS
ncbi:MAG: DUF932 domain-containing protein [Armatimonadota bacterium]